MKELLNICKLLLVAVKNEEIKIFTEKETTPDYVQMISDQIAKYEQPQTIYILSGEQAVKTYFNEGVQEVKAQADFYVTAIEHDPNESIETLIGTVFSRIEGCLDSTIITREEYEILEPVNNSMADEFKAAMEEHGYELVDTGGGCTAYKKEQGEHYELITVHGDPDAPTQMDETVDIGTYSIKTDEIIADMVERAVLSEYLNR